MMWEAQMEHLKRYVLRAADELRAAERAACPKAAEAHRLLAEEYMHLIRCDGSKVAYRRDREKRQAAGGPTLDVPIANLPAQRRH